MSVHVAIAVIINNKNQVLITKRSADKHQGDKWEFPGGKVESTETSQEALYRELKEEIGITVESATFLLDIVHQYKTKEVLLDVYEVRHWIGEAQGLEGQPMRWVDRSELSVYKFPSANAKIISKLS